MNWQLILDYITEHALIIGVAGTFTLITTTIGSITAHHVRKLRRKTAPKIYLNKGERLKAKARRWEAKKIEKKLVTVDETTKSLLLAQLIKGVEKQGGEVIIKNAEGNEIQSDTVLKLG